MDAFFASVEQRDDPSLRGKPVAVGGGGMRGVVAAASYEARQFGVHSAMPSVTAKRLCPDLIFVKSRFDVYKSVSQQIRDIFHRYTDLVEPLSLDEAYLDVTYNKMDNPSATLIAREIRKLIWEETALTASAGISFNKFLAKTASGMNKPNGMTLIRPEEAEAFLEKLPIDQFYGIGKVTATKMHQLGIHTGIDLKKWTEYELARRFGKSGRHYYRMVRAQDERPVNPDRIRKSIGAERTFLEDLTCLEDMQQRLAPLAEKVFQYMEDRSIKGRTVTLKIKTHAFKILTRSRTLEHELKDQQELIRCLFELLDCCFEDLEPVRLLGLSISNLSGTAPAAPGLQLSLDFDE